MTRVRDLAAGSALTGLEKFYADNGSSDVYQTSNQISAFAQSGAINVINVKSFPYNAQGDGTTDDTAAIQTAINAALVVRPPTVANAAINSSPPPTSNFILYFPPGIYNISSPLSFVGATGGVIMGAGRFSTQIVNTAGSGVIFTNGCSWCKFADMSLQSSGGATLFFLSWDGAGTYAFTCQGNTLSNMMFQSGARGLSIGQGSFQASENLIENCFFANQTVAGLQVNTFNALQQTVIGGDFQSCATGILILAGSVPVISGVGFQGSTNWDIQNNNNGGADTLNVIGCRTESKNFVLNTVASVAIAGCGHYGSSPGTFLQVGASGKCSWSVKNCLSVSGQVVASVGSGSGLVEESEFGVDIWYSGGPTFNFNNLVVGQTNDGVGTGTHRHYGTGYVRAGTICFTDTGRGDLVDAATILTDPLDSAHTNVPCANFFNLSIAGNRTMANPAFGSPVVETASLTDGQMYYWAISQGAGGNHLISTWGSQFTFTNNTPPTLSTAAGATDILAFVFSQNGLVLVGQATNTNF